MPAIEEAPNTPRRDVILIADASAEGQTIATALRAQGYAVAFSAIEQLEARVLGESPRVLLVDIDQPGARDAIERIRDLPEGADAELVCLGSHQRAAEIGATSAAGRSFERPVDIHAIIAQIAALAEPAPLDDSIVDDRGLEHVLPGETLPPGMLDDGSGAFPTSFQSAFPGASEIAEMGASIFPPEDGEGQSPPTLLPTHPMKLSPELRDMLSSAEKRVNAEVPSSAPPGPVPEDETDLVLGDEFLAILDDPIDDEDEEEGASSDLSNTGGLDPGTGPNALSLTTGAFTSTDANVTAPGVSLRRTGAIEPPSVPEIVLDVSRPFDLHGAPAEMPATWEPRSPHSIDETSTPIPTLDALVPVGTPEPAPAPAPEPPAYPRGFRYDEPSSGPATAHLRPPSLGSLSASLSEFTPRGATFASASLASPSSRSSSPSTAQSGLVRSMAEPPPSVRLAPPVPPPPAPISSPSEPLSSRAPRPGRPTVLGPGDAPRALARAIASRATGSLAIHDGSAVRRIVLHDGDVVTAGTGVADEALLSFLAATGDLERDVARSLAGKLPPSGRHAGAALIAHGYLQQDALWPVLRAHAEWIIGHAISVETGTLELESEPPGRLRAEPNVFGGATGAEVFVEIIRRVISPEAALARLGGPLARLDAGPRISLLAECALRHEEAVLVERAPGTAVGELVAREGLDVASLLYALVCLEVLGALSPPRPAASPRPPAEDTLDEDAVRMRIRARLALVDDGDYFAILGIARTATSYEIRRAYLELRRFFEPSRLLTPATVDLASDVRLVLEVLDEAYEILKDGTRRERYRRAIEAGPPS